MIKSYEIFTTHVCPKCFMIKEFLKTVDIKGQEFSASSDEGLKKAAEKKVAVVPTVILFDEQGNEVNRVHTLDDVKTALQQ
ncbi:MAG: hypothetical protein KKE20_02125 [Nanoarchaeota archaeon]|nr:hypothetical protein [Nanoarchaeota archaeon]